ncbi:helix-turn-helix transcriptional regulator [Mucilaginibacter sp. AK015]|uniref:helix-turn-helix domain-containing protein n=1 Tax=Mucilaginibacter sp. AK015 TaxID=2723072 RepID=UPI001C856C63|nr:helix-turn-helix transcriptional regulator [Mucilaginibacter sp. AK015]
MVVRTFLPSVKIVKKPLSKGIPLNPQTLGDHIRKVRIERGLLQKSVADTIGVCEDALTFWENNRSQPQIHHCPAIIDFLQYYPFSHDPSTISGKLKQIRHYRGLTYQSLGNLLGVNASTARQWEMNNTITKRSHFFAVITLWVQLRYYPQYLS